MNLLAYGLIALAILGGVAGLYGKVHHDGVIAGRAEVQDRWDAASKKAQDRADANRMAAKLTADTAAAELSAAQHKATTFEAKWRIERAKQPDSTLAGCPQSPTANATGTAGTQPSVRFSSGFLRLYDRAWTDDAGQPVFGDRPAASGEPAATPDALTSIGPGEVLDNHAENAARCSADRRALNALIGQIEKLQAGWR